MIPRSGKSGVIVLDDSGDRDPAYWITDMDPTGGSFARIAELVHSSNGTRVSAPCSCDARKGSQGRCERVPVLLSTLRVNCSPAILSCSTAQGMTGRVIMDANGDRMGDYRLSDMTSDGTFVKIAEMQNIDLRKQVDTQPFRYGKSLI